MTEYEMASFYHELFNTLFSVQEAYMAGLFGFVAVGYFIGPNLNRVMTQIIIGLFTLFAVISVAGIVGNVNRMNAVLEQIAEAGPRMEWFAQSVPSPTYAGILGLSNMLLLIGGFLAAVIFFLLACRRNIT